jgi:hypothetical protein
LGNAKTTRAEKELVEKSNQALLDQEGQVANSGQTGSLGD